MSALKVCEADTIPVIPTPSPVNEPVNVEPVTPPANSICEVEKSPYTRALPLLLCMYSLSDIAVPTRGPALYPTSTFLFELPVKCLPAPNPTPTLYAPSSLESKA